MTDILERKLVPSPDAATSAVGDETVILHLVNGTYHGLDPLGTQIWEMMVEGVAIPDICRQLEADFEADLETIEIDARAFLTELEKLGMLVDG